MPTSNKVAVRVIPSDIVVKQPAQQFSHQEQRQLPGATLVAVLLRGPLPVHVYVLHISKSKLVRILASEHKLAVKSGIPTRVPTGTGWLKLPAAGHIVAVGGPAEMTRGALARFVGGREPDAAKTGGKGLRQ